MKKQEKKKVGRRNLLKLGSMGIAALAATEAVKRIQATEKIITAKRKMAMVIDLRRCYGCHACAVSCKSENGVNLGAFRSWVNQVEIGKYPYFKRYFLPRQCNHCDRPPCIKVCPTGATYKREDGVVLINKDRCIGCRYCMTACPYDARSFVWHRRSVTGGRGWRTLERYESLDFPARRYGVVDKCDLCVHRIDKGLVPACVNTCPAEARIIGDLQDPNNEVTKIVSTRAVSVLYSDANTGPHVFYRGLHIDVAEKAVEVGPAMQSISSDRSAAQNI